jgi:hypothetical protein
LDGAPQTVPHAPQFIGSLSTSPHAEPLSEPDSELSVLPSVDSMVPTDVSSALVAEPLPLVSEPSDGLCVASADDVVDEALAVPPASSVAESESLAATHARGSSATSDQVGARFGWGDRVLGIIHRGRSASTLAV